jgi:hypothetical protein
MPDPVDPDPVGICLGLGVGALEVPAEWTRIDDPDQPSESAD